MAIAFDAAGSVQGGITGSITLSWSHTTTGTGLTLLVYTSSNDGTTATGVTYNSIAMTKVLGTNAEGAINIDAWKLPNPATGANTITVTWADSVARRVGMSLSFTGVDTASVTGSVSGTVNATSGSVISATTNANSWLVTGAARPTSLSFAVDTATGGVARASIGAVNEASAQSLGPITGNGTARWTSSFSNDMAMVGVMIQPTQIVVPSTVSGYRSLLRVGQA